MSFWSIFSRKKWANLGQRVSCDTLYTELWKFGTSSIYLRDRDYRSIPFNDFQELIEDYRFPDHKYVSEKYDCEQFAIGFMADIYRAWADVSNGVEALTFGYVEGHITKDTLHAFIWVRDDKGVYRFIEPQTNKVIETTPISIRIFEG